LNRAVVVVERFLKEIKGQR